jgi:hypothetical protein
MEQCQWLDWASTADSRAKRAPVGRGRIRPVFVPSRSVAEANVRSCIGCKQKLAGVHPRRHPRNGGAGTTQN